jgi:uncharacterized membrane protein HdeD (DUF308 family)
VQLSRLFQPRKPAFWLMLTLNLLSSALAWVVQTQPLSALGQTLVAVFAIGNGILGLRLAWLLMSARE